MVIVWDALDSVAMMFGYMFLVIAAVVVILGAYASAKELADDVCYKIRKKKRQRQREKEEQEKESEEK